MFSKCLFKKQNLKFSKILLFTQKNLFCSNNPNTNNNYTTSTEEIKNTNNKAQEEMSPELKLETSYKYVEDKVK
jgi:hypothetical protein